MKENLQFNDETIQEIFGFEDAESESIERLKEYYFKKDIFERVMSNLPVRILVGHKGTGKSALFKVAISEEKERGNLPILIKPDDIAELGKNNETFLLRIRQWKDGLTKLIGNKVFSNFDITDKKTVSALSRHGLQFVNYIIETINKLKERVDLSESQKRLTSTFLKTKKIVVYIDDLDRGWEGKKEDITRISALLNCIRDMANENPGLLFKVSLRSDVYYLVRTSDESTDKIEGAVVWCKWDNQDIFVMLIKRIQTYFEEEVDEKSLLNTPQHQLCTRYLKRIMESPFLGHGKWKNIPIYKVLMSLTRKRPRDLVKLCSLAAQKAYEDKSNLIKTEHFQKIFEVYSQGRIQDTINEYKSELPLISNLLFGMKPNRRQRQARDGFVYTTAELTKKLNSILERNTIKFKNGNQASAKELATFLYKINFLTARKKLDTNKIERKYFEENQYISSSFVDYGYDWEVHPAFRWALQPEAIEDIFDNL